MDYEQFASTVEHQAAAGRDAAERATRATLQTLAERLSKGEAVELARRLPEEAIPWLFKDGPAERFDVDEFVARVAERERVDLVTAERHARAVFAALRRAAPDELADVEAELPQGFRALIEGLDVIGADEFTDRVAERAGLDLEGARRATDAALETLAERIAGGDVDDLLARLPIELHPPLKRGRARSGGEPEGIGVDEFVARVAEHEGTGPEEARQHTRAVLAALREATGEEFFDAVVQLGPEYTPLLPRPERGRR
jgi:uncharacterized protein (DUF2267 family)